MNLKHPSFLHELKSPLAAAKLGLAAVLDDLEERHASVAILNQVEAKLDEVVALLDQNRDLLETYDYTPIWNERRASL